MLQKAHYNNNIGQTKDVCRIAREFPESPLQVRFIAMKVLSGSGDDSVDDFCAGRRIALQDQMSSWYFMDIDVVEHFFKTLQTGFRYQSVSVCLNVVRGKVAALKAVVQPRNFLQSGCKGLRRYLF